MYLLLLLVVALLIFSMVQNKRRRAQTMAMNQALEPGVRVMTTSGIYGLVTEVEADTIVIEISEGVDVRFAKQAVMRIVPHLDEHESGEQDSDGSGEHADGERDESGARQEGEPEPVSLGKGSRSGHESGAGAVSST